MNSDGLAKCIERIREQKRTARKIAKGTVDVGWVDGSRTIESNTPFAVIARTLNYGREAMVTDTGRKVPAIPARPFMKKFMGTKYQERVERMAAKMITQSFGVGASSAGAVLKSVGAIAAGELKKAMRDETYEPNAEATVAAWAKRHAATLKNNTKLNGYADGSSLKKPLVDTGALLQAIGYVIKNGT